MLAPGARVGALEVIGPLGRGGMEAVDRRVFPGAAVLVLAASVALAGPLGAGDEAPRLDVSQAERMVAFLEKASRGEIDPASVDAVLEAPGTELVIGQMNLVRRVTPEQYRGVLLGLGAGEAPPIAPVDGGDRAARGVAGLRENVWPALRWGMKHTDLLGERLAHLRTLDVHDSARSLAMANLPEPVELSARLHVVMGGRAGAAALEGGRIYVDPLWFSFLEGVRGRPYPSDAELVAFFAHEMHHLGYDQLRRRHRASLELDTRQALAYRLLSAVLSEGSATWLINDRRDAATRAEAPRELLGDCERVLRGLTTGEIRDEAGFEAATPFLLGSGAHTAGAWMLSRVDRAGGLEAVMDVMRDPRRLPAAYNAAVEALGGRGTLPVFDAELAATLARLGS